MRILLNGIHSHWRSEEGEGNAQIRFSDDNLGCSVGASSNGENRQSSESLL